MPHHGGGYETKKRRTVCPCHGEPWHVKPNGQRLCPVKLRATRDKQNAKNREAATLRTAERRILRELKDAAHALEVELRRENRLASPVCPCHGEPWYIYTDDGGRQHRYCVVNRKAKKRRWNESPEGRAYSRARDLKREKDRFKVFVGGVCIQRRGLYRGLSAKERQEIKIALAEKRTQQREEYREEAEKWQA